MARLFSDELLRQIRNDIPIDFLVRKVLVLHCKHSEGYVRYLCPKCQEMRTAFNPRVNLARCFLCEENFNTIEMTMLVRGDSFIKAAEFLQALLKSKYLRDNVDAYPVRS